MTTSIPLDYLDQLDDLLTSDSTSADMLKSVYDTGGSSGSAAVDLADGILGGSAAGNSKYYGTSPTGVLGFNSLPTAGHAIKEEGGAALTQRANLNFIGASMTATDNAGTAATDITSTAPILLADVTVTVGAGKDYATIQEAINYFVGKIVSGTCTIDVDAGTYAENLTFDSIQVMPGATLWLKGDTRTLAGLTYVDHTHGANSENRTNGGSADAACALTTSVNNIVVTVTGTSPDFDADNWVNGDKLLVYDDAKAITEKTISSTSDKTITLTAAAPTVGGSGSAVCLCPNRVISIASGTGISTTITGLKISGFYIKSSVGTGNGISAGTNATVTIQNVAVWKFSSSFINTSGQMVIGQGCVSAWEPVAYGFYSRASLYSVIYYITVIKSANVGIINDGGATLFPYRGKAVGGVYGCYAGSNCFFYPLEFCAINNSYLGFYVNLGAFIYAVSSNARCTGNGTLSATDGLPGSYVYIS